MTSDTTDTQDAEEMYSPERQQFVVTVVSEHDYRDEALEALLDEELECLNVWVKDK